MTDLLFNLENKSFYSWVIFPLYNVLHSSFVRAFAVNKNLQHAR